MTATQNRSDPTEPQTTSLGGTSSQPGARRKLLRSRTGGVWVVLIAAAVVLLFLLIFILQNGQQARVSFLGASGELPMGVALLLAAVFGVLLVAVPGTVRILQLRGLSRRPTAAPPADRPPSAAAGSQDR